MRKKDEMEQAISNKSIKISWFVTFIVLLIAGNSEHLGLTIFNDTRGYQIIGSLSVVLYLFLDKFYYSRVTDKKNFWKYVGLVILLAFIMIWITLFLVQ